MQDASLPSAATGAILRNDGVGGPSSSSPRLIEVGDSNSAEEEVEIDNDAKEKQPASLRTTDSQIEPQSHVSNETSNRSSSRSSHTAELLSVGSAASPMRAMDQIRYRLKRPSTATIATGTSGNGSGDGLFLDATSTMSGFLRMRQSAREWRMKTWYCVLFNAHLSWYATKKDAQVAKCQQGQVHVVRANVSSGAGKIYVYPNAFTFTASNGHEYFCSAPTPGDQKQWIESMSGALQQHDVHLVSIGLTLSENQEQNQLSIGKMSTHSASSSDSSQVMALECVVKEIEESCRSATNSNCSNSLSLQASFRRAPSSIRSTGRLELVEKKKPTDIACFACEIEFSALRRRKYICGSCGMSFCRWHCSKDVILSSGPAATMGARSTRVCDSCAHRQHFVSFVVALTSTMVDQLKSTKVEFTVAYSHDCFNFGKPERLSSNTEASSIASCEGRFSTPCCHRRQWDELQLLIGQPASFTALNLMCFLRKYQRMPWLFARTICLFIPIFETDPEALAKYWAQFVGMFVLLIQSVYPDQEYYPAMMPNESAANDEYVHVNSDEQLSSLHLYMDITLAICRRSSSFALRTVWECLALFEDARLKGNVVCANYIMLLIYLVSAFDGDSELVANIWLKNAPEAQTDAIVCAMDDYLYMTDLIANAAPMTPTMQWIHAKRESDIWTWRQRIVAVMSNSSSSEEDEMMDPENLPAKRILGIFSPMAAEGSAFFSYVVNAFESIQQAADEPPLDNFVSKEQLFNAEANFVYNLTAITERLRHVTPVSSRSKVLPGLLHRLQQTLSSSTSPTGNTTPLQYLPFHGAGGSSSAACAPKILRVVTDEGKVFSTRCRAPTMLVFEAILPEPEEQATSAAADYTFSQFQGDIKSASSKASHVKPPSLRKLGRQDSEMLDKLLCSYEEEGLKELVVASDVKLSLSPEVSEELENEPPPEELSMEDARLVYEESTSASMLRSEPSKKSVETWAEKSQRIKEASEYGSLPGWTLVSIIAKSFDDLRQEVFALQLMSTLQSIFEGNDLGQLYLRPYKYVSCLVCV